MRRVLMAFVAVMLVVLPNAFAPAHAAPAPLVCDVDPAGDVSSVKNNVVQPEPVAAPKADLRRFCASLGDRLSFRWRVPGVDPTADPLWGSADAFVLTGVDTDSDGNNDFLFFAFGPFTEGHFFTSFAVSNGDGTFDNAPCAGRASSYDAVNKVIKASLPASCMGSPASFRAIGESFRDPTPETLRSYLFDDSAEIAVPAPV